MPRLLSYESLTGNGEHTIPIKPWFAKQKPVFIVCNVVRFIDCSLDRSLAHSIPCSLDRSLARSLTRGPQLFNLFCFYFYRPKHRTLLRTSHASSPLTAVSTPFNQALAREKSHAQKIRKRGCETLKGGCFACPLVVRPVPPTRPSVCASVRVYVYVCLCVSVNMSVRLCLPACVPEPRGLSALESEPRRAPSMGFEVVGGNSSQSDQTATYSSYNMIRAYS